MDGYIVGSMISANSITGEQIQANSIKTANLELSVQKKIQDATNEETVKALIKADLDGFESTLSKEFVTVENATTQIQQATEVAVKEATQSIIDNAVSESMGAVDGQLNDKLNQYTGNTLLPAIAEKAEDVQMLILSCFSLLFFLPIENIAICLSFESPIHLSPIVTLTDGIALIVFFLTSGDRYHHLGQALFINK